MKFEYLLQAHSIIILNGGEELSDGFGNVRVGRSYTDGSSRGARVVISSRLLVYRPQTLTTECLSPAVRDAPEITFDGWCHKLNSVLHSVAGGDVQ